MSSRNIVGCMTGTSMDAIDAGLVRLSEQGLQLVGAKSCSWPHELRDALRPGGQLVLETLVVEGTDQNVLVPPGRYAKMRNVWFIPAVPLLERWLRRVGFSGVRTVDVSVTRRNEQRATEWMTFESLADFLDPADSGSTIEGYPAPMRAVLVANA